MEIWNERAKKAVDFAAFLDTEDVITKFRAIQLAERRSPYVPGPRVSNYWERVQRTIKHIDQDFRQAAMAVFASVFYITSEIRDETLRYLAFAVSRRATDLGVRCPEDIHVFAVDNDALVELLYKYGEEFGWKAFRDQKIQDAYKRSTGFIQLLGHILEGTAPNESFRTKILSHPTARQILDKQIWVIINDNALSGVSAISDASRLARIVQAIDGEPRPRILVAAQVMTEQALNALLTDPDLLLEQEDALFGLYLDEGFRITSDQCHLFSPGLLQEVRGLCIWFGKKYFSSPASLLGTGQQPDDQDPNHHILDAFQDIKATIDAHRSRDGNEHFAFGWSDGGYTLVDFLNTPNNSVPLLWYPTLDRRHSSKLYSPPFPRRYSRIQHVTGEDKELAKRIEGALQAQQGVTGDDHE